MSSSSPVASAAGELLRERDRAVQRLRSMALAEVPAGQVLATAQRLADLAADADADPDTDSDPDASLAADATRRTVPALQPYAAGDQLTVLVGEVQATASRLAPGPAEALLAAATAVLTELRRDS